MNEKHIADQKRTIKYLKKRNSEVLVVNELEIRNEKNGSKGKKRVSTIIYLDSTIKRDS